jgi:ABC-2 type transport system ATP-binding protein
VVLDEPIAGLDPVQIVEMRDLVRNLRGEHTVIVSSHILTEISETCDRILVIKEGEIRWQGSESELSAQLTHGMRVQVTVRVAGLDAAACEARARQALQGVADVEKVETVEASESGDDLCTLLVTGAADPRDELCRALVGGGVSVLELGRRRELEGLFLELVSEPEETDGRRRRKRKRAADAAEAAAAKLAAAETTAAETGQAKEEA